MISLGCDAGAITTKAAILRDGSLLAAHVTPNDGKPAEAVRVCVEACLSLAGIPRDAVDVWAGTGSGERYIGLPHREKSLIACLARAAHWALPSARTLVDIGGLTSTCVSLNGTGRPMEYRTSDRCASGTGFFLELAAQALELRLEEMSSVAAAATGRARISAQCAVFGESEIVTHVNDGVDAADIMAGISYSIGSGLATIVRRLGVQPEVLATGGVAKMGSVVKALGELLGVEVHRPQWDPQVGAAIGAALCAAEG